MDPARESVEAGPACRHDHVVEFYETEAFLVDTVCEFLAPALLAGQAAIVVATAAHRHAFDAALSEGGVDVDAAMRTGRYQALDAADVLSRFMVDGKPDAARFGEAIGAVMDGVPGGGHPVHVYGEMVALLFEDGETSAALALEDMWNDLATSREFALLCAYPMRSFENEATAGAFHRICEQHTTVIPSESYSLLTDPADQSRAVAQLQQQTAALHVETRRLRVQQEMLAELAYLDSLTGLGNRRAFDLHLEREWMLSLRDGIDSFVVVADLDGFKHLNDSCGHAAGDEVLRRFADAMRSAARNTDILARIGGDEFAALLVRCNEHAAHGYKIRLGEALTAQEWPAPSPIGVSVGHASLLRAISPAAALHRADLAMLASKHSSDTV